MECPECGTPMAEGFLGYPAYFGGRARWYRRKTRQGFGGESLGAPNLWQVSYLDAFRCASCRLVVMRY